MTKISSLIVCVILNKFPVFWLWCRKTAGCKYRRSQVQRKRCELGLAQARTCRHTRAKEPLWLQNSLFQIFQSIVLYFPDIMCFGLISVKKKKSKKNPSYCEIQCVCQRNLIYHFKFQSWATCLVFKATNSSSCLWVDAWLLFTKQFIFVLFKALFWAYHEWTGFLGIWIKYYAFTYIANQWKSKNNIGISLPWGFGWTIK